MSGEQRIDDYKVPDHLVSHTHLIIFLDKNPVKTRSKLEITPNDLQNPPTELQLDCENITVTEIKLNDQILTPDHYEYHPGKNKLIIKNVPKEPFIIETSQTLRENTDLFGLYKTGDITLIKAETLGMRRVFPCIDRPDVSSRYTTKIVSSDKITTLLANGKITAKKRENGRQSVTWTSDHAFPTYLYAMVAGNLQCFTEPYLINETTQRKVDLEFYLPSSQKDEFSFAAKALALAMAWDKKNFNFEYPLNTYKIAGVDQYASGASETFGLNLFNLSNLLGKIKNRTVTDILRIYKVVAHEYFHMLSGNLITIRDWFNLSLKEGLTTFRESMFMESTFGTDMERLFNNKVFDDRAPRPSAYTNVRSLYSSAAYDKSAEIFRMMMLSLPGTRAEQQALFFSALQHYFTENMNKAVTLETLINSVSTSTSQDMSAFLRWFTESGVPKVNVNTRAEIAGSQHNVTITFTVEGAKGRPIPMAYALYDSKGNKIQEKTIILNEGEHQIEVTADCIPTLSLLRNLSAPVHVDYECLDGQLISLIEHDDDIYNRVNAAQKLFINMIEAYCRSNIIEIAPELISAYRNLLQKSAHSPWDLTKLLPVPSEEILFTQLPAIDFSQLVKARESIQKELAFALKNELTAVQDMCSKVKNKGNQTGFDYHAAGMHQLKTVCQTYLSAINPEMSKVLLSQFNQSLGHNMTDTLSALTLLGNNQYKDIDALLARCYTEWKDNPNEINYWLSLQASMHTDAVTQQVKQLLNHSAFKMNNPNNVNALIGSFIKNPYGFHAESGEGYQLVAHFILDLEKINPSLAANLTNKFSHWEQYSKGRQSLILACLDELDARATTSEVKSMLTMVKKREEKMGKRKKDDLKQPLATQQPKAKEKELETQTIVSKPVEIHVVQTEKAVETQKAAEVQAVSNEKPVDEQVIPKAEVQSEIVKAPRDLGLFSTQKKVATPHVDPVFENFASIMLAKEPF